MQTNTYDANKSLSAYYANRDTRNPARLWATEKLLHDLAALGLVEFFEGEGGDPTQLAGYAPGKLWLQVVPGVTTTPGIVRGYDGVGAESSQASWPEVTRDAWSRLIPIDATDFQVLTGTDIQTLFEETDAALHTAADAFLKSTDTSDDLTEGSTKLLMTVA
jgi:hypothetical protein